MLVTAARGGKHRSGLEALVSGEEPRRLTLSLRLTGKGFTQLPAGASASARESDASARSEDAARSSVLRHAVILGLA